MLLDHHLSKTASADRNLMKEVQVILVNEKDEQCGEMGKIRAHEQGLLHRAFSVFIFNSKGEMLLQQRAFNKYHSGGLWSNACCSHPSPGEKIIDTVQRRLKEELGFNTEVEKIFDFIYKAEVDNDFTEHEFDHVFAGVYDGLVVPDKMEVSDFCYKGMKKLKESMDSHPLKYTVWLQIAFPRVEQWWKNRFRKV